MTTSGESGVKFSEDKLLEFYKNIGDERVSQMLIQRHFDRK